MKLLKEFVDAIRFVFREKKNLIYIEKFVVLQKKTTKKTIISKANKDKFCFCFNSLFRKRMCCL